jgi:hypothetical protein
MCLQTNKRNNNFNNLFYGSLENVAKLKYLETAVKGKGEGKVVPVLN